MLSLSNVILSNVTVPDLLSLLDKLEYSGHNGPVLLVTKGDLTKFPLNN